MTILVRARLNGADSASEVVNNASVGSGQAQQQTSVAVQVTQPTPTLTPVPRSAPLPRAPQGNTRLPHTGTQLADVFDLALLFVLGFLALFCLSMAARAYRR